MYSSIRNSGGNPLAVVLDSRGLTTDQVQSVAAELNFAETTFILPPKDASHSAEVRIFTPRAEMPFAGHPNIGTAFVVATLESAFGRVVGEPLIFEEKAGLVKLDLIREGAIGARLAAPQSLMRGEDIELDVVAKACSIEVSNIETANHNPCITSCGVPFLFAELKTRSGLSASSAADRDILRIT
jgi:trans-2,3-dihydro-3-hydroxyanthranilate isomerase